jgi:hypothetical protein
MNERVLSRRNCLTNLAFLCDLDTTRLYRIAALEMVLSSVVSILDIIQTIKSSSREPPTMA